MKIPDRNLLVYSLFLSEPIVEIKVSTLISVVPRFEGTLDLIACIANHKPFEEGEFPKNALVNIFLYKYISIYPRVDFLGSGSHHLEFQCNDFMVVVAKIDGSNSRRKEALLKW